MDSHTGRPVNRPRASRSVAVRPASLAAPGAESKRAVLRRSRSNSTLTRSSRPASPAAAANRGPSASISSSGNAKYQTFLSSNASFFQLHKPRLQIEEAFDNELRRKNLQLFLLALVGVLFVVAEEESHWRYGDEYQFELHDVYMDDPRFDAWDVFGPLLSAVLVWRLIDLYKVMASTHMFTWSLPSRWHAFWSGSHPYRLSLEILMALVTPLPHWLYGTELAHSWSRFLGMCAFARLYLYARVFRDHNEAYKQRHRARANRIMSRSVGFLVVLRSELRHRPLVLVGGAIVCTVMLFSYLTFVLEREAQFRGKDTSITGMVQAVWFCLATFTTVGYGDVFPSSSRTYAVAFAEMVVAIILSSVLVAVVIEKLSMRRDEKVLDEWISSRRRQRRLEDAAARLLQQWWRFTLAALRDQLRRLPRKFRRSSTTSPDSLTSVRTASLRSRVTRQGKLVVEVRDMDRARFHLVTKRHVKVMRRIKLEMQDELSEHGVMNDSADVSREALETMVELKTQLSAMRSSFDDRLAKVDNRVRGLLTLVGTRRDIGVGAGAGAGAGAGGSVGAARSAQLSTRSSMPNVLGSGTGLSTGRASAEPERRRASDLTRGSSLKAAELISRARSTSPDLTRASSDRGSVLAKRLTNGLATDPTISCVNPMFTQVSRDRAGRGRGGSSDRLASFRGRRRGRPTGQSASAFADSSAPRAATAFGSGPASRYRQSSSAAEPST